MRIEKNSGDPWNAFYEPNAAATPASSIVRLLRHRSTWVGSRTGYIESGSLIHLYVECKSVVGRALNDERHAREAFASFIEYEVCGVRLYGVFHHYKIKNKRGDTLVISDEFKTRANILTAGTCHRFTRSLQ